MRREYSFFQNGGAAETEAAARTQYALENPTHQVVSFAWSWAMPGRPGEGRWVGFEVTFEVDRDAELAAHGLREAAADESGWYWRDSAGVQSWVTDLPAKEAQ